MRIVTLEEHYTVPELEKRIPQALIAARGFPGPDAAFSPASQTERLAEFSAPRLQAMDEGGVTVQVLSLAGPGADILPPDQGPDWARELNDTLARHVTARPDRFAGFAHLPMTAPDAAADELERCVREHGFCGAMVNGVTEGRFLDHPSFAPILARAEQLEVPIYIHPGIPPKPVREAYYDGLPHDLSFPFAIAGWGWHAETAVHVLRLVLSGVFDRHPKLQVIIGHMGEGLPTMLARCDQVFGHAAGSALQQPISQMITSHVHVTTSGFFTETPFLALLQTFGADRILYSVDYPFSGNAAGQAFLNRLPVSPADRLKIASGNADRLLRLKAG